MRVQFTFQFSEEDAYEVLHWFYDLEFVFLYWRKNTDIKSYL